MSNKVQLIKQEIERIEQILDDFNKTHNNTIDNGIVSAKKNICKHIKSFIDSLPEEPASEDTCLLGHDYKNRDCENCSFELCKRFSKPVNEDLEEELHSWMKENCDNNGFFNQLELARHFAKWQRKKDQETIELAEDHAMLGGMMKEREEMMKDAVEGKVCKGYIGNHIIVSSKDGSSNYVAFDASYANAFCIGDKVKIIILKEEQR